MEDKKMELQCEGCGQVFAAFLKHMAEHNQEVTCPECGKSFRVDSQKADVARPSGKPHC
jgi:uncharacterized Zn-finger protein